MDRDEASARMAEEGMALLEKMKKKLVERVEADSYFNGIGKVLKALTINLENERFADEKARRFDTVKNKEKA